ncbi:alpha/beta-hydrolase [Dacryopinax primogenitus]|uniref:Alpha/beta-hydrolase n=1 Tax=Dacryopinax primogenitus (strain DJM 731) TaxID=1858805 RepID=M5G750_DACPD|nr:alpha/beta-hydrolase [Dacryopinax primogenitus]EJT99587.1 alpha/beta-hydrolase [Dacryopinax primogenitus]
MDSKGDIENVNLLSNSLVKRNKTRWAIGATLVFLLLQCVVSGPQLLLSPLFTPTSQAPPVGMDSDLASGISWFACPDVTEFDCAFFSVPLSYATPVPDERVSLALRRYPATAPKDQYLGTLFTNPGGPGGSGTAYLVERGPALSKILSGRYDILSWDPRGVNMTTPPLGCYTTDFAEFLQEFKQTQLGLPMSPHYTLANDTLSPGAAAAQAGADEWYLRTDAYYQATVSSCAKNGNSKILSAVSTAHVVQDIRSMLFALGEEDVGLNYWGFSYGTILGATFSAMFPELLHRVLLDGVSDSVTYTRDMYTWGKSGMNDTHLVWEGFLKECAAAGPTRCALAGEGRSAEDIETLVWELEERLLAHPMPVAYTGLNSGILTASDVRLAIFAALYKPFAWPSLAKALAAAISGDGGPLIDMNGFQSLDERRDRDPLDNVFHRYMARPLSKPVGSPLSTEAIMCSDTLRSALLPPGATEPNQTYFRQWAEELALQSPTGENWARWIGRCRWWNVTAAEVYRGPWTKEEGLRKTKFPVVFFSMDADPVTPLSAATSMASGFGKDSATLVINRGYGHCSIAHPSMCVAKTMRAYFFDGVVPEWGTTCTSDPGQLFPDSSVLSQGEHVPHVASMTAEDVEIWEALQTLASSEHNMW